MSRCLVALAVLMALSACGPADTLTTTTIGSTTASSSLPTTSTSTASATTTTIPTTTTTSLLEGNWAELPLIVIHEMALGWWDGTAWVQVEEGTSLPVSGGEDYQIALLGGGDVIQGGPPENSGCDVAVPSGLPGVPLSDGAALYAPLPGMPGGATGVSGGCDFSSLGVDPPASGRRRSPPRPGAGGHQDPRSPRV